MADLATAGVRSLRFLTELSGMIEARLVAAKADGTYDTEVAAIMAALVQAHDAIETEITGPGQEVVKTLLEFYEDKEAVA
jgi:hypothetical protein